MAFRDDRAVTNLTFNQDHGLFSCCTDGGVKIFNVQPLAKKAFLRESTLGTVSICEMLGRTNCLAFVSGGMKPKFADNSILIWDDARKDFVFDFTFPTTVLAVKLQKERLIAVLMNRIYVFSFPHDPRKLFCYETKDNPQGLIAVAASSLADRNVVVFPGSRKGNIHVVDLNTIATGCSSSPTSIQAHQSELAYLSVNYQGTMVATASVKGTLIRVFDTKTGSQLIELRRGADTAKLYCINFSHDNAYLCASSDKGTVHIFALKDTRFNKRSAFERIGMKGTYAESQWSLAKFTVRSECACICAFGGQNSSNVLAICTDGSFQKYVFTPEGNCNRESYDVFLDVDDDDEF